MKRTALILSLLTLAVFSQAQQGPIRVLYVDSAGTEGPTGPLHDAMRELGRDAIWFDHATTAKGIEADYDAILDAKDAGKPEEIRTKVLAAIKPERKAAWEAFL